MSFSSHSGLGLVSGHLRLKVFDDPPALILSIGMFLNMNSAETSSEQSKIFSHDMAIFHEVALESCLQQCPGALICFVSCNRRVSS